MQMREITVQVPDELAGRLERMKAWLPTVIELGLAGFRTRAIQTASEVVSFLAQGPSAGDVAQYHVSDRAQARVQRLLSLQAGGQLSLDEQEELDELERIEHTVVMLKSRLLRESVDGNAH
jgi:hypothetical protein